VQFAKQFLTNSMRTLFLAGALSVISSWRRRRTPRGACSLSGRQRLIGVSFLRRAQIPLDLGADVAHAGRGVRWRGRWAEPGVGPMAGKGLGGGWRRASGIRTRDGVTEWTTI
jgi:hypothetical protein